MPEWYEMARVLEYDLEDALVDHLARPGDRKAQLLYEQLRGCVGELYKLCDLGGDHDKEPECVSVF